MRSLLPLYAVGLALTLATGALAQAAPPPPPNVTDAAPGIGNMQEFEAEKHRRLTTPGGDEVDREALADRVATLVDQGRCDEARQAAREAGDRAMSRRIGQICREGQASSAS